MSSIRIERATANHPDDALLLIEEYYEAVGVLVRDDRRALLGCMAGSRSGIWVAYAGAVPAGCILLRPLDQPQAGEIKRLYVRPAYRRRGIAAVLLGALEQFAAELGISCLYLDSKDDLKDAIAFYSHHGYTQCARYNENPQATIFMRKQISRNLHGESEPDTRAERQC